MSEKPDWRSYLPLMAFINGQETLGSSIQIADALDKAIESDAPFTFKMLHSTFLLYAHGDDRQIVLDEANDVFPSGEADPSTFSQWLRSRYDKPQEEAISD